MNIQGENLNHIRVIADRYGYDAQSRQCIEEMAELTQSINKFWRKQMDCGRKELSKVDRESKEYKNLIEELADVQIMILQMQHLLDEEEAINDVINEKVNRQLNRP